MDAMGVDRGFIARMPEVFGFESKTRPRTANGTGGPLKQSEGRLCSGAGR
jgi:hypothetical protein